MIVVDASTVVDHLWGVDTKLLDAAPGRMHSPHLLDHEVVSALRRATMSGQMSATRADEALTDFADLRVVRWMAAADLRRRAFELRHDITAYDAAYVALAEALDCPLVTRDERLARTAGRLVDVHVL